MYDSIHSKLAQYSWYHCIDIGDGIKTPGQPIIVPIQRPIMEVLRQQDLAGKSFLDIGCRDGLFSFEAEKMGASRILGIDNDLSVGASEFLIPHLKSKVVMRSQNVYDLAVPNDERFDCVLFAGVLYHLRFPFLGLKRVADATRVGGTLILETAMWATQQQLAALYCPAPQDSPYEPTSVTFYNDAGLVAALESVGFTDVQCRHVMSEDGQTHSSWTNFLASSYWNPKPPPLPSAPDATPTPVEHEKPSKRAPVARAVYTATKTGAADGALDQYWYGTHNLNSDHAKNHEFLNAANVPIKY